MMQKQIKGAIYVYEWCLDTLQVWSHSQHAYTPDQNYMPHKTLYTHI